MYARLNIIFGEQDLVDVALAHIEDIDRGVVEATPGNRGLTTLVDRSAGVVVALSYWDEPLSSSEAALTQAREAAAAAAGGDLVVERFAVVLDERGSAPAAVARMARMQVEPARVSDGISFIESELLPALRIVTGFCGAELLIDTAVGNGVLLTTWDDDRAAARSEEIIGEMRHEAVERAAVKFPRTEGFAVVRAAGSTLD